MVNSKLLVIIIFLIFTTSCAKQEKKVQNIKKTSQELEMTMAYKEAYDKLKFNDNNNKKERVFFIYSFSLSTAINAC